MTWAAVAVVIVVVFVVVSHARSARGRVRPLDPERFRRALDAMAPNGEYRDRTGSDSEPSNDRIGRPVVPRPRPADRAGN